MSIETDESKSLTVRQIVRVHRQRGGGGVAKGL